MHWAVGRSDCFFLVSLTLSHPPLYPCGSPHTGRGKPQRGTVIPACTQECPSSSHSPPISAWLLIPDSVSCLWLSSHPQKLAWSPKLDFYFSLKEVAQPTYIYVLALQTAFQEDAFPWRCPWLCFSQRSLLQQSCSETWLWNLGSWMARWWEVWIVACPL